MSARGEKRYRCKQTGEEYESILEAIDAVCGLLADCDKCPLGGLVDEKMFCGEWAEAQEQAAVDALGLETIDGGEPPGRTMYRVADSEGGFKDFDTFRYAFDFACEKNRTCATCPIPGLKAGEAVSCDEWIHKHMEEGMKVLGITSVVEAADGDKTTGEPIRNFDGPWGKIDDGGERISYGEGKAIREPSIGKGRYDLVTPFGVDRLAKWYELGAAKYADRNWEKGIPFSRYTDSAERHLNKWKMGMDDEDHLAAAAWNIFAIMHHQELGQTELDDMPHYLRGESNDHSD